MRSRVGDAELDDRVRALEDRVRTMQERLKGNERRDLYGDTGPVSIDRRLRVASLGTATSTYGPTPTHVASLEIAEEQFAGLRQDLDRLVGRELPELETQLDEAGVPWTPGRPVPQ